MTDTTLSEKPRCPTHWLPEVRDKLVNIINIIDAPPSQNFSNDMEREQALDSWSAWARDFLKRTSAIQEKP